MIQVPRFNAGDALSREYLDTLSRAITELQNRDHDNPNTNGELSGIVQIVNNSGAALDAFDVLGIEGPYIDPSDGDEEEALFQCGEPVLSGVTPVDPDHLGKFAILLEPIAAGQVGHARVTGSSQAWVDIQTVGDEYADILDADDTKLVSGSSGMARILWTATASTGEQWALVQLGGAGAGIGIEWGHPTGAWEAGTEMTLDPCDITGTDLGTVENGFPNVTATINFNASLWPTNVVFCPTGATVPTTTLVPFIRFGDEAYVLGMPKLVATGDMQLVAGGTGGYLQIKQITDFGLFSSTVSDWINIIEGSFCEQPA